LREALAMGSEHLSCYEVIYEQDTPLFEQLKAGQFSADEDLACAMYDELVGSAGENGFKQYEVANFAREKVRDGETAGTPPSATPVIPSLACRHNVNYWRGGSYYGLGPSAAGYVRGERTKNVANTQVYCARIEEGAGAIDWRETLPPLARAGETAAFGLRMNSGWPLVEFKERTGYDLATEWRQEIEHLVEIGHGHLDVDAFRLTPKGMRFADSAAEQFLRPASWPAAGVR
jgi:oxygen-independent coproporphyrinogen III oxidase